MPTKGLRQAITKAMHEADKEISGHASRGGMYAHGLASEGYSGGYRDALQDVLLALNGVRPNRRFWWNTVGGY